MIISKVLFHLAKKKGFTEFEVFVMRSHNDTFGRVFRFQTNGKVEKLFDGVLKSITFFSSADEYVESYNMMERHLALDPRTPIGAYYKKMFQLDLFTDASILGKEAPP